MREACRRDLQGISCPHYRLQSSDATEVIAWALANRVQTWGSLDSLALLNVAKRIETKDSIIPVLSVPTSLSDGEYSSIASATNDKTEVKTLFAPPENNPTLVILDLEVTATSPEQIRLSTGVRSVDYCVESPCRLAHVCTYVVSEGSDFGAPVFRNCAPAYHHLKLTKGT